MRLIIINIIVFMLFITTGVHFSSAQEEELQYSLKKVYYSDAKRTLDYDFSSGTQDPLECCENVDQIVIPDSHITGSDKLNFVFNLNHTHFSLETASKSLILRGTTTPTPGCTSYGCSSSGGMEYTDGIFNIDDALALSENNFFYAVRLQDFKAFSSDKYNAFIFGFQGNNLTQSESYPQARVTAKWIKGYYCGELFEGDLVLESQIYTDYAQIWDYSVAGGEGHVVAGTSDPSTVIIDLAIEATDNGQKVIFYYRTGGTVDSLTKESGDWIQYATYSNSGTAAFYGYPVNKGLQSLMASDLSYPPDVPADNPVNQDNSVEIISSESTTVTKENLSEDYRIFNFNPVSNKKIIVYNCAPGSLTTIRSKFSGMSRKPSELNVAKLKNSNRSLPYGNYRTSFSGVESGDWGITESDGTTFIDFDQTLTPGAEYFFYLFIQDNDPIYDLNPALGVIEDPVVLGIGMPRVEDPSILFLVLPAILNAASKKSDLPNSN